MDNDIQPPSWKTWSVVIGIITTVFVVLVISLTLQSRSEIRQQIVARDGHVLSAVASMLQSTGEAPSQPNDLEIALLTSRLRGVLAVRLFDQNGDFIMAVPVTVAEQELSAADRRSLQDGSPVSRFHSEMDLNRVFYSDTNSTFTEKTSIQEVAIPLHDKDSGEVVGIVQYLIDGQAVQEEFSALDRTLLLQAGTALALALGGFLLFATLAFARIRRSQQALANRTQRLVKANKELSLAARTSAVGAVSSHLIHGIRNAITGLDLALQMRAIDRQPTPQNWDDLKKATDEIRAMVDDVVELLRAQEATSSFKLTLEELEAVLSDKLRPKATRSGVYLHINRAGDGELPGHAANMILLIVVNLVDNALAITPKSKSVHVHVESRDSHIAIEVNDEGPGIPEEMKPHLFTPGRSGRSKGTGLGLAISHRLATHLNATLQLDRSDSTGTTFTLLYPLDDDEPVLSEEAAL